MTTETYNPAAQLLGKWISGNRLVSQHETYLNEQIRTGRSFYTDALATEGRVAAEQMLQEWIAKSRMNDFAAGIEPVASGMLALARIDTESKYTKVVAPIEQAPFPHCHDIYGPSNMVVVFNRQVPACSCKLPDGAEDLTPYGQLGLMAVTLEVGNAYRPGRTAAQLGLVLPSRARRPKAEDEVAYVVVTADVNGYTNGHTYHRGFYHDTYLEYALGLADLRQTTSSGERSGGELEDHAGFPGATQYLADALPRLAEYFAALATDLNNPHTH